MNDELLSELIQKLERLASKECWSDFLNIDADVLINDLACGHTRGV